MNKGRNLIERIFFLLLVFLLPTQLAYHFWPSSALVYGIRVDYLSPAIYFTDILILSIFIIFISKNFKRVGTFFKQNLKYWLPALIFIFINIFQSGFFLPTIYKWIKLLEFGLLALYIFERKFDFGIDKIVKAIFYSIVCFSIIGITQFIKGETVGSLLYFLGERTFNSTTPGIALVSIAGREFMRAYSTFPHPNSFAGYLAVSMILTVGLGVFENNKKQYLLLLIPFTAFLLTFSLSAVVAVAITLAVVLLIKKRRLYEGVTFSVLGPSILVSLLFPLLAKITLLKYWFLPQNISGRLELSVTAESLISKHFLLGVGLNKFIPTVITDLRNIGFSMFLQPVHNIYLLVLSETGVVGLMILCYLLYKFLKYLFKTKQDIIIICLLLVVVSGVLDHYWLTLQQNLLLLSLLTGLSVKTGKSSFT